jgi:hypothetical protein
VQNVKGARPLSRVQISTMALKDNLLVAGGFQGELICKVLGVSRTVCCTLFCVFLNFISSQAFLLLWPPVCR